LPNTTVALSIYSPFSFDEKNPPEFANGAIGRNGDQELGGAQWSEVEYERSPGCELVDDHRAVAMLRCAVLSFSLGTALRMLRNPTRLVPLGSGAGPILTAGCSGKRCANFSKNAWRFGYNI
jgi:hypothetical protein